MSNKFEITFLENATDFLEVIDPKARVKLYYVIDRAKMFPDPKFLKKLDEHIWEFRVESRRLQYRLFCFWDKRSPVATLVVCTHGFIKKTDKVPNAELIRAHQLMKKYFTSNE